MFASNLYSKVIKTASTRDGFGDALLETGAAIDTLFVLTADLKDSTKVAKFAAKYPKRFIEVGVAEQNMVGIAAGLAQGGKIPVAASYAVFLANQALGQIRLSVCYSNTNVKLVASHAGLSASPDGATHQALEDIAIMRTLPNMTVLSPADYFEAKKATFAALKHVGPVYLRLARPATPVFTTEHTPFALGKATVLTEGTNVTVVATGPLVYDALLAANELNKSKKFSCEVINCSTIKPLDGAVILKSAKKTGRVVTVEEHQVAGGLGGAVAELLSQALPTPLKLLGVRDSFGESGTYEELKDKFKLSAHHIAKAVTEKW